MLRKKDANNTIRGSQITVKNTQEVSASSMSLRRPQLDRCIRAQEVRGGVESEVSQPTHTFPMSIQAKTCFADTFHWVGEWVLTSNTTRASINWVASLELAKRFKYIRYRRNTIYIYRKIYNTKYFKLVIIHLEKRKSNQTPYADVRKFTIPKYVGL